MIQRLLFFAALSLVSNAWALSNQILWIPDIKGLQEDICRFEMQDLATPIRQNSDTPGQRFNYSIGAACGVYQSEQIRFEAGLDWREGHDYAIQSLKDGFFGQVQLQLFDIDRRHWGLALGAYDVGFNSVSTSFNVIYLMGLHQAGVYRFGLGAYSGNSQLLLNGDGKPDHQGAMIGAWRKVSNGDIGLEVQTGNNRYGYLFLGGRMIIAPKTYAVAGYGKANDTKIGRDWILIRVGFVF